MVDCLVESEGANERWDNGIVKTNARGVAGTNGVAGVRVVQVVHEVLPALVWCGWCSRGVLVHVWCGCCSCGVVEGRVMWLVVVELLVLGWCGWWSCDVSRGCGMACAHGVRLAREVLLVHASCS